MPRSNLLGADLDADQSIWDTHSEWEAGSIYGDNDPFGDLTSFAQKSPHGANLDSSNISLSEYSENGRRNGRSNRSSLSSSSSSSSSMSTSSQSGNGIGTSMQSRRHASDGAAGEHNKNPAFNANQSANSRVSDALIYGPLFCKIYKAFVDDYKPDPPIDPSRHLMALYLDYLIPFCCWSRKNDDMISWIRETLLENDYLRAEVRNGLVIVLMYTFAAMKATLFEGEDMFTTLQCPEKGVGIANRFSLKIFNDPFLYMTFLKTSISSLIDAGKIPDNVRQSKPIKHKSNASDQEELSAFESLKQIIVDDLDQEGGRAKDMISNIATYWQQRSQFVRNRRFMTALSVVKSLQENGDMSVGLGAGVDTSTIGRVVDIGSRTSLNDPLVRAEARIAALEASVQELKHQVAMLEEGNAQEKEVINRLQHTVTLVVRRLIAAEKRGNEQATSYPAERSSPPPASHVEDSNAPIPAAEGAGEEEPWKRRKT